MSAVRFVGLGGALLILADCGGPGIDPLDSLLPPVNGVEVYGGTVGTFVEAGDTARINAEGFHDGNGARAPYAVRFSVNDSTIVHFEPTSWTLPIVPTIRARGLREGLVTVTATINGVSGSDSLRIIPTIQSIVLTPNPATVHVNDTITVKVVITAVTGAPITTVRSIIQMDSPGYAAGGLPNGPLKGLKPGTTTLRVTVGHAVGTGTLVVIP